MPEMSGIELLKEIRELDNHVPVVLVTGEPTLNTAVQALEFGALHYLTKPIDLDNVERVIHRAVRMHRMSRLKEQAAKLLGQAAAIGNSRTELETSFERALDGLWVAYQPIVKTGGAIFGYEALMRSNEPRLPHPGAMLDAAERLDQLPLLGRTVRGRAAEPFLSGAPAGSHLFVNLHVSDLADDDLMSPASPLSRIASRVVLEITERASLDEVRDVRGKIAALREMGFRIAVDDMGAGYAGLTSFALLEPEIVKLDMSLVRGVHSSLTKQKVIRSMTTLCNDMGMMVVAEGVETVEERDTLDALGCDLFQGFLLARPGKPFPEVTW
jgi:EAL domain-containing protein (putative c-di-GMP-specific phosphodiesterase class I)